MKVLADERILDGKGILSTGSTDVKGNRGFCRNQLSHRFNRGGVHLGSYVGASSVGLFQPYLLADAVLVVNLNSMTTRRPDV